MNNTSLETKSLLLSNLTNPIFNVSEIQRRWITTLIMSSYDLIDDIHSHLQQKKIEVFEIPELVRIYSKTICDKSNQLHMFDLDNIIKMVSFITDVLVTKKILIVNGDISNENVSKLVINCTTLLNISIVEHIPLRTMSDIFSHMYLDFIKVLTEPLID